MKCCSGQSAQRDRDLLGGNLASFIERAPGEEFGQQRAAGDGGDAAARLKPRCGDAAVFQPHSELENIAARRIADFDDRRCTGKVTRIARILEMVENGRAVHAEKYRKPRALVQCAVRSS